MVASCSGSAGSRFFYIIIGRQFCDVVAVIADCCNVVVLCCFVWFVSGFCVVFCCFCGEMYNYAIMQKFLYIYAIG